jgi:hypothetical protein
VFGNSTRVRPDDDRPFDQWQPTSDGAKVCHRSLERGTDWFG